MIIEFHIERGRKLTVAEASLPEDGYVPTREQRDTDRKLLDEFVAFASERMVPGGRCHENDIVREFRLFYPRYRRRPLGTLRQPVGHAQVSPAISLPPPAHAPSGLHLTRARPALDL